MNDIDKAISQYRWSFFWGGFIILMSIAIFAGMLTVVVPREIENSVKNQLDSRHGVLIQQMQVMLDAEFHKNLSIYPD